MSNEDEVNNAQIMHTLGKLVGTMESLSKNVTEIREDIRRNDQSANDRLIRVENNLSKQIDAQGEVMNKRIDGLEKSVGEKITGLGTRVTALESEDKKMIEKVARLSAFGGGVGGALAAGAVELIKRL